MQAYFFETSATVKRYVREQGTKFTLNLFKPSANNQIYVAGITLVEVISALTRRHRGGSLNSNQHAKALRRFRQVFQEQFLVVDVDAPLIEHAALLAETHALRGYDAVQLAAALEVARLRQTAKASPLTLVSADAALNTAAQSEGLQVDNPNNYP